MSKTWFFYEKKRINFFFFISFLLFANILILSHLVLAIDEDKIKCETNNDCYNKVDKISQALYCYACLPHWLGPPPAPFGYSERKWCEISHPGSCKCEVSDTGICNPAEYEEARCGGGEYTWIDSGQTDECPAVVTFENDENGNSVEKEIKINCWCKEKPRKCAVGDGYEYLCQKSEGYTGSTCYPHSKLIPIPNGLLSLDGFFTKAVGTGRKGDCKFDETTSEDIINDFIMFCVCLKDPSACKVIQPSSNAYSVGKIEVSWGGGDKSFFGDNCASLIDQIKYKCINDRIPDFYHSDCTNHDICPPGEKVCEKLICKDSDGGNNAGVKGTTQIVTASGYVIETNTEYCVSLYDLQEFFCENGKIGDINISI